MPDDTPSGYSLNGKALPKSTFGGHYVAPSAKPSSGRAAKPRTKPFSQEREELAKAVAGERLAASQQVYDTFGDRPYNAPDQSDEEQNYAYAVGVRENAEYLNKLHAQAQKKRFLPPDVLDRRTILGFMEDEARYKLRSGEWDDARYQKAMKAIAGGKK